MTETILGQLDRLADAKADIKTSIESKGVTVSGTDLLDTYASYVDSITPATMGYTSESDLQINSSDDTYECIVASTATKGYHDVKLSKSIVPSTLGLTSLTASAISASGKTVTVPAGYYSSSAVSKSVADGSYSLSGSVSSTPTATLKQTAGITLSNTSTSYYITVGKNAVTNGSVTHSASITSGYIASGTSPTSNSATAVGANVIAATFYIPAASTSITTTSSTTASLEATPSESVQYINTSAGYIPLSTIKVNAISSTYVGSGILNQPATTYNTSTTDQLIAAKVYLAGVQTIRGVTTSGISAENIKTGVNVNVGDSAKDNRIVGVIGTFTKASTVSDGQTAASAAQIRSGYSAWVDGAEVKGSLANGTITNNTSLPSGSSSSGTITDGYYIKIGAGYYSSDIYYYAQNWAYKTNTSATIDVNDLTITPSALVGTWDSTNNKYIISQAAKSTTSQSTVTTAGYISSTVGTKNTGSVTVSAPSNLELAASTWGTTSDSATYTSLSKGTKYKLSAGYYPYDRYYQTQSDPTLSGNASAGNVLSGVTFYSNSYTKQTGTMTNNGAVTATISSQGGTYTIPAGYHNGSGKVTASITAGSAKVNDTTVPVTISGPTLNAKGYYMINVSGSTSVSPSITAGYISSGTAGTVSVNASQALTTSTFESATLPSGQTAIDTTYDTVYKISAGYNTDRYIKGPSYSTPYNAGKTDYNPASSTLSNSGSLVVKNAAGTQIYTNSFSNSYTAAQTKYEPYSTHVDAAGNIEVYNYAQDLVFSDTTDNSYNAGVASVTMETLGYTAETALSGSLSGTTYTVSTPNAKGYHGTQLSTSVTPETLGLTARTSLSKIRDATRYTMTVSTVGSQGYYTSQLSTDVSASDLGYTQNTAITVTDMSDADNDTYYANVKLPYVHGYNTSDLSKDVTPANLGLTELSANDSHVTFQHDTVYIDSGFYSASGAVAYATMSEATLAVTGTATSGSAAPTLSSSNVGASTSTTSSYYITVGVSGNGGSVKPTVNINQEGFVQGDTSATGSAVSCGLTTSSKTIYIPASGSSTSTTASGDTYATVTPSTSVQYRNFTAGYTPAGNFKIEAISTQTSTNMAQPNSDTTLSNSSKPYRQVTICGYYRGYTTTHFYPRVMRVGSTSAAATAIPHYSVTLSTSTTIDSTTYYRLGYIPLTNYEVYMEGGEVIPAGTLINLGACYEMYRTSSTSNLTNYQFNIYLYRESSALWFLTSSSVLYLPHATSNTYAMWKIFSTPLIFLSKTNSTTPFQAFVMSSNTIGSSTTSRYSTAGEIITYHSDSIKDYYSLPGVWYGYSYSGLGYQYMYLCKGMYFYGSSTSSVTWKPSVVYLTLG